MFQHLTIVLSIIFATWVKPELVNLTNTELKAVNRVNFRITRMSGIFKRFRFENRRYESWSKFVKPDLIMFIYHPCKTQSNLH